ncbi:hypothetical protein BN988_03818 [Oceanobacillus picturae]|uniref:Antitoxin VbhA domain-containing protein n=1 Tax=Oceanobacillus picturae TaxID=171693 RepID=W9AIE0_9BACI|nr:hypothetical protein [Oceanobacillus picturae]CDO05228.1 hypothetical protein BN988_03818 [Oceanobacillus picturae]
MNKAMEYVKATQAMEELIISKEQEELILDSLNGEISEEEFEKKAKEIANWSVKRKK